MDIPVLQNKTSLNYTPVDAPGYTRKRSGRGFAYFDDEGNKITSKEELTRIRQLAIPPMWTNVWICRDENGHIQATGRDARNRKQYLYHTDWTAHQQQSKFSRLLEFGYTLPLIRKEVEHYLRKRGWPREKVLALVLAVLDETYVRIGNRYYYETNGTHGLTTLRRKNLEINGRNVVFRYKAKSNKIREVKIRNNRLTRLITQCSELRGYEIFRYMDEHGKTIPVDSGDVNAFLREITGKEFTSKNFRTWGGAVLAVKLFPEAKEKTLQNKRLKLSRAIVKEVAKQLGNTISICEKYYIHPTVLQTLCKDFNPEEFSGKSYPEGLNTYEKMVLAILEASTLKESK
ncbi:Eukaryotic DNA topoisomerase I, catalytic core [anaerobic digester metagenome]